MQNLKTGNVETKLLNQLKVNSNLFSVSQQYMSLNRTQLLFPKCTATDDTNTTGTQL